MKQVMGEMVLIIFALVLSILVAVFAIQNSLTVTVSFLMWGFDTSLVIIILGAAAVGALAVWCISIWSKFGMSRRLSKQTTLNQELQTKVDELQKEVERLQAMERAMNKEHAAEVPKQ